MKPRPPRPRPPRQTAPFVASTPGTLEALEWEELPSLVGRLHAATARAGDGIGAESAPAWDVTQPAAFDAALPDEPFRQTMQGLDVREVREPEVFRHFFGGGNPA